MSPSHKKVLVANFFRLQLPLRFLYTQEHNREKGDVTFFEAVLPIVPANGFF